MLKDSLFDALRESAEMSLSDVVTIEKPEITLTDPHDLEAVPLISDELRAVIKTGYQATWSFLFDTPRRPLVSRLAKHHHKTIKWHWAARHRLSRLAVEKEHLEMQLASEAIDAETWGTLIAAAEVRHHCRYLADFEIWSRGHMKTTVARRIAVVDALISMYYGVPGYCLYVSGTGGKIEKHSKSVDRLLKSAIIQKHAPLLAQVKRDEGGSRTLGWSATFFYTSANYVFHFGSLGEGLAGGNVEDIRPTCIILDDIDSRENSVVQSEKNFQQLTTEILPMGTIGTLTIWPQNYINRYSSLYKIDKEQVNVLVNRRPSKPIPAITNMVTEPRRVAGGPVRDVIVAGEPTWQFYGLKECQDEINRMGLPAFLRECQHDVEASTEGLMLHAYDDAVHVISESEFCSVYGTLESRKTWSKWLFNDWARTKTKYHANVAGELTVASQNRPLPGFTYLFNPMSFMPNSTPEDVAERILGNYATFAIPQSNGDKPKTWQDLRLDTLHRRDVPRHLKERRQQLEFERKVLSEIIPQYSKPVLSAWNVLGGAMSHSEDTVRDLFRTVYGIFLSPSNPGKFDALDDINRAMMVDYTEPHPFRPHQLGYSRWFIVVPDDTDDPEPCISERTGKKIFRPRAFPGAIKPDDLHDHDLIRYQFCNYRRAEPKLTVTGETIDDVIKTDDDFFQGVQMVYHKKLMTNVPLSDEELVEEHMPAGLTEDALENADPMQRDNVLRARLFKIDELKKSIGVKPALHPGIGRIRRR